MLKKLISKLKNINKEDILVLIKTNWIVISIAVVFLFLLTGYCIGRSNTSKSSLLSNLEVALKEGKPSKLDDISLVNGQKVEKEELEPLIDYYKSNSSRVDSTIKDLKTKGETDAFKLRSKDSIFGEKYYLDIKTYSIKINSNFKEARFQLNDNKDKLIVSGNSFLRLVPGIYNIKGTLKSEYGNLKVKDEVLLMSNEDIELNFNAVNLKITSTVTDAEVYINDKDTKTLVLDNKEYGPLSSDGSVKVHIEKDYPWGRLTSEEVEVRDVPSINLEIDMRNDTLLTKVSDSVDGFYNSVFDALNEENKDLINNCSDDVKEKIYNILEQSYFILKNKYIINEINIKEDNSDFKYENGTYNGNVIVEVHYTVSKYFGITKEKNSKSFSTKVIYKDGNWVIEDVDNFSL